MNWTVIGGMVHVNIPHGTVVLSEDQLKAMVKSINDERGQRLRGTLPGDLTDWDRHGPRG